MYKIMLVDDEIWSLIGLRKLIESDRRFEVIYDTTTSTDALEQIIKLRPDAVITDIRMPEMNGIELMQQAKQHDVSPEFIVISGYAEFSYVQQALQEGALDYQLKPFDKNTIDATLQKLFDRLNAKREIDDLSLYTQLRDSRKSTSLLERVLPHPLYRHIQIVSIAYKPTAYTQHPFDVEGNAQCLFLKIGANKCLGIVNSDADLSDLLYDRLDAMRERLERASLSRSSDAVDSLSPLIREAERTAMDAFVYPKEKIFRFRPNNHAIVDQLENTFLHLYAAQNYRQMSELLRSVGALFRQHGMGVSDAVYLWNRFVLHAQKAAPESLELVSLDHDELLDRFENLEEMCSHLNLLFEPLNGEELGNSNSTFFELIAYIEEHYAEALFLKELCSRFYINMSYCCVLFKKHKNMTFSQYLTEVRIGKACELLTNPRFSVAEVCEMTGYRDYFYFNKVFKKKMGCTPAEYRRSAGQKD